MFHRFAVHRGSSFREKVRRKLCKASRRLGGRGFLIKAVMIGQTLTSWSVSCSSCPVHRQEIPSRLGVMKSLTRQIGGFVRLGLWSRVFEH